ncbi:MFS transporter [Elstera cyanobacteriorum]|uniref:MFS transporter n=1 Tax=Elstera cyanobacteriorum TaxID=2022747 RepID=UPI002353F2BE|nr:MFS transporter [Elstera cyanobacteriorum]MCK6442744.1 MFS transporter [Elstera cyanobacteriorum]
MTSPDAAIPGDTPRTISAGMTFLLAAACGLIAANLYYAQPLAGPIRASLGLSPEATGLIVTLTQIGYGLGLLLIVPLGDLLENRRLILTMIGMAALALIAAGLAPTAGAFLAAALLIGLASVAVQIIVPFAAHMAPEAARGQVVGNVMSGLMAGIMLARPVSSFIADILSWRAVFFLSTLVMGLLALVLAKALPQRRPQSALRYGDLLASLGHLALHTPILQRRALYQAALFGAFSLFWTVTPLVLAGPAFSLSQSGIALFALAGAAGTVAAPIAGRLADRGWSRPATAGAMILGASAFLVTHLVPEGSTLSLGLFVAAAILLDFGATVNIVLGQRAIFALGAESRSRLNGLYMATFFAGGAIGSAAGGWAFAHGGWAWASWAGMALPIAALLYWMTERRG